jgi:hypothetical protein
MECHTSDTVGGRAIRGALEKELPEHGRMYQKRHAERRETLAYWPAKSEADGRAIGLVTDLSEDGLGIHSEHGFRKGQTVAIRIAADPGLSGMASIPLVVRNVWCHPSGVDPLFHSGFRVVKISAKARACLHRLEEAFSYPTPGCHELDKSRGRR